MKIAIFASGGGSNAQSIIHYFENKNTAQVALVVSNKAGAGVVQRANNLGIPIVIIDRQSFYHENTLLEVLDNYQIELIVLAGFLWWVPGYLISAFERKILNIHPALLPSYGGKGMYGMNVHAAVKEAGATMTGMTIHLVNEKYDDGRILFQAACPVYPEDGPAEIAVRVMQLEHKFYPKAIEYYIRELKRQNPVFLRLEN
ncbi:MAG TPA: phosphoribosylglycinamide formyltransferase [Saprospiraceae bacterium]|nr:phosphoribosylglycinamide formyltransferase [Saprospiraceae bacterium]